MQGSPAFLALLCPGRSPALPLKISKHLGLDLCSLALHIFARISPLLREEMGRDSCGPKTAPRAKTECRIDLRELERERDRDRERGEQLDQLSLVPLSTCSACVGRRPSTDAWGAQERLATREHCTRAAVSETKRARRRRAALRNPSKAAERELHGVTTARKRPSQLITSPFEPHINTHSTYFKPLSYRSACIDG